MTSKGNLYKVVAVIVSLGLLFQVFSVPGLLLAEGVGADVGRTETAEHDWLLQETLLGKGALPTEPAVLAEPITLSRVQSEYQAGSAVVVSYTVTNNQPPANIPNVPDGATITETTDILAGYDLTSDPNTIHNLTLATTLTADGTYVDSSSPPVQSGDTYTWTLDDLAPQASVVLTVSLGTPANAADFTDLEGGMTATADLWDMQVMDTARPAALAPDVVPAETLEVNPEVDLDDADMLWRTAELNQEPLALFSMVQAMGYDPYEGSLRGTRGTLWSGAGNSLDQSSLLIAMLRAAGVPARYRHGSLDVAEAQTLLATMFPESQGVAGYVPAGTDTADPLNDAALIAIAQDHWWVEAYLPGLGWTDLDPVYPGAAVGQSFATPAGDGTDQIAEVPDEERHKVTIRLKIEQYSSFPIGGNNLNVSYPLSATVNTAEVAAHHITLAHIVDTETPPGIIFSQVNHTYLPYLVLDGLGMIATGDSYMDLLTTFPLASQFTSGQWLEFDVEDPDGNITSFSRTVKDLIGLDARIGGGLANLSSPAENAPLIDNGDLYATWIMPNTVPEWALSRRRGASLSDVVAAAQQAQQAAIVAEQDELTPEDEAFLQDAYFNLQVRGTLALSTIGLNFAASADKALADREIGLQVKQFFDTPRVFTIGSVVDPISQVEQSNVDLRKTDMAVVVYPGQANSAERAAYWSKGVTESYLEGEALSQITEETAVTTYRVFEAMSVQGIEPILLGIEDADLLNSYNLSPAGYAFAAQALFDGKEILIPSAPVLLDGELRLGWWEIDPATGQTVGVTEAGLHGAAVEYGFWIKYNNNLAKWPRRYKKVVKKIWEGYLLPNLLPALGGFSAAPSRFAPEIRATADISDTWHFLGAEFCPHTACGVEQFFTDLSRQPIPLPEMLFGYLTPDNASPFDEAEVAVVGVGGGDPAFTLTADPATSTLDPNSTTIFQADIDANFNDTFTVTVTAPDGWTADIDGSGQVMATPPIGAPPDDYAILLVAQSSTHTDLFGTAVHTATITALQDMALVIKQEPNITIPAGTKLEIGGAANDTNDGQAELEGMAFTVNISNTSTVSHTFNITVTGQPASQVILNGVNGATTASVTLPAGGVGQVGLYVLPPAGSVPGGGTTYPVDVIVTAEDDPSLTDTEPATPTVGSTPFSYLTLEPAVIYATENSTATFDISLTNVGNAAGSFPLSVTVPVSSWLVSGLSSPVALNSGAEDFQTIELDINNAAVGFVYPLLVSGPIPSSDFSQLASAKVQIVSENAGPIFVVADELADHCTIGEPGLSATVETLASLINELEASCDSGSCSLSVRDEVVDALNSVAAFADVSPLITADDTLATIAIDLAGHSDDIDIQADIVAISSAVATLETEVCELTEHTPTVKWLPAYNAGLVSQPVSYTLEVTNQGTVTTTYAVTVSLPSGTTTYNVTDLAPGETDSVVHAPSSGAIGLYDLSATARATGPDVMLAGLIDEAEATLNVVDKFIQLTAVTASPDFVETGTSSTDIKIDVTNIANIAWDATAETRIFAPGGGISYTADIPVTLLIGDPKTYDLATVDTSSWAAGLYTITVDLVDGGGNPITEGSNYGYLGVGQALGVTQSVEPALVAPGTVTVTTVLTTEILAATIISPSAQPIQPIEAHVWQLIDETAEQPIPAQPDLVREEELENNPRIGRGEETGESADVTILASLILTTTGITRTEQDESSIIYTGTWNDVSLTKASSGSMGRADDMGDTATFTFTGTMVTLGFIGSSSSANVEVFIDGVSEGVFDLYRRENTPLSFTFDNFITGTHTISVTHTGLTNPFANNDYVQLDYIDVWDGTTLPDGTFEQDSDRVFPSNGWNTINNGIASGGSYFSDNNATAWFPFSGDSVSFQAIAFNGGGTGDVYIDGQWKARLDFNNIATITRTLSFENLGAGQHMMMVTAYQDGLTVDAFTTPGTGPFYTPITPTGFTRFEDDDPAMLYNGLPFTVTSSSWTRNAHIFNSEASDGQYISSNTLSDTVSLTFDGVWASVGFFTEDSAGMAEIFIDGVSQGVVDTYSNEEGVTSVTFDNLITGTHTLSVTVLDTANPLSINTHVYFDYIDVWDGASLPSGTFEQDDARVLRGGGLTDVLDADASGGSYMEEVLHSQTTVWFPFEGDSITYQGFDYFRSEKVAIYIDDVFQDYYAIYTGQAPTITYSFDGLGPGLHMMKVVHYRDELTLDAFHVPAITAPTPPPTLTTFTRYEEDYPEIRYNGLPYTITASSWFRTFTVDEASDGQFIGTQSVGDTISFDFDGTWIGLGFVTDRLSGQAEVFIDGVSQGVVELYTRDDDVIEVMYGGLADTSHTISMTLLATTHPNSTNSKMLFDYYETWDGTTTPSATYEEVDAEVRLSDYFMNWDYFVEPAASGGAYANDGFQRNTTAWFPFTGDSVTFLGLANSSGDRVRITIDGVDQGTYNLYNNTAITRAYTFNGLGAGPHIMQVRSNRSELNLDAFVVPGFSSLVQTPVYTGVVRYEEDHPELLYNNLYNFTYRPQSWGLTTNNGQVSGRWHVSSGAISDSVSLEFDGNWAAAGFRVRNSTSMAEIFIDGVSQGIFDLQNPGGEDTTVIPFGGLVTGTHTISVSVVAGTVYFDYFDVWDGQPMSDDIENLRRAEDNGRLHYSGSLVDVTNANAIEGDYMATTLLNTNSNIWYTFVGDSFTFIGFSRANTTNVDLFVDGVFIENIDVEYPFSPQPLAFHYSGFGEGPHVVRIHNGITLRADAFQSNPEVEAPYAPTVEWYDTTGNGGTGAFGTPAGMLMGIASGDVDGDGLVEIVAPSDTFTTGGFINSVLIYRGDGLDTGDGDPLIRRIDFPSTGIGVGRETIGSVALADLDGLPGAEIIIGSEEGMYAFKGDGSTLWFTDTYKAVILNATPAIGNLDFDNDPEIVVNMDTDLVVYEADGDISWSTSYTSTLGTPVLADMNNDGRLDIIVYDSSGVVYLYDYNFGSPTLLWSHALSSTVATVRGGPAVVDLDGDGTPEIAMTHDGAHTVLDKDGNEVWSIPLDPGSAGGVSVADIDGDFAPEIVTGIKYDDGMGEGRLYAINADGSILWEVPAYDNTSANSQSVLDINGDGVYEIAWNGADLGFTIFNGADGSILFNEPLAESLTGTEYPIFADVDQDGYAEVVIPTNDGIVVLGQDGVWGEARPIWNQHTYHITNINDDMSVPFSEANSWDVHNTYRTQWPEAVVLPVYDVTLTHTVGITDVAVVSATFSVSPTTSADPLYGWDYSQSWASKYVTRTFDSVLTNLQPGESRLVSQGTEVTYQLPSGINHLTLPPMYVSVPHIINVEPLSLTVGTGGTAVFDVVLDNPALASETYTLTVAGLTDDWVTLDETVVVGAGSQVTVSLTVDVPASATPGSLPFNVFATNSSGGQDSAAAELILIDGLNVSLEPDSQTADAGTAVTYTLVLSNFLDTAQTYTLTAAGGADVTLPPTVTVPAGTGFMAAPGTADVDVTVSATTNGSYPFTIEASNEMAADSDTAVLEATGNLGVGISLAPSSAVAGPLTPAVFTATVTNLGSVVDVYDLDVSLPAGWTHEFKVNGNAITTLTLTADVFNSADVLLLVTPDAAAIPGPVDIDVSAQSQANAGVSSSVTGTVDVQNRGVVLSINPQSSTMLPTDSGLWQVTVTNTGSVADSFWLTMTGFIGPVGNFSANPVALNAGQSTTVQLTADDLDFMLPGAYQFSVSAESQNNALIKNQAIADVTFESYEAVAVDLIPVSQTVTDTLSASYIMVVSNTGNVNTTYDLGLNLPISLTGQLATNQLPLPAHVVGSVVLTVQAAGVGTYLFDGTADSTTSAATDSGNATLEVIFTNLPPTADAGGDETADEGELINFNGTANDPESQPLQILWDFGDGNTASGTLTPTHAYEDDGLFTVTLIVTDTSGLSASDTLEVNVSNVAPTVSAGGNQTADEGDTVSLDPATFTDPGGDDTHTATIDWGDGTVEAGTVNQAANTVSGSHTYQDNGLFTVTVTVTDDDSGSNSDTFTVNVSNVDPSVNAGGDQTVNQGETVFLDPATFTDPGGDDTHTATIDWDDGTVEAGTVNQTNNTVSGSHVYTTAGTYTVTVTVMDDDGGMSSDTFTVVVIGPDTYYLYMPAAFSSD